jgi:hypothetical protein
MAKKVKTPVEINAEVKVKKTKVSVKKKDKKLDVKVETPKARVVLTSDEEKKDFNYDGQKLDVQVTKTNEGTKVNVVAETPALKRVGKWVAHMLTKKFNRK